MRRLRAILMLLCAGALLVGALGLVARARFRPDDPDLFRQAARTGDLEQILIVCRSGADVNAQNAWGAPPLFYAVLNGSHDVAKELLDHGADAGWTADNSWSLLHVAARSGDAAMVELLMRHGADPHAQTTRGYTPLHAACTGGRAHAAAVLTGHGADMEARTGRGLTPLHLAAKHGRTGVVEYLVRCGADMCPVDRDGHTPSDLARAYDWPDTAAFLDERSARGDETGRDGGDEATV